jgi:hypothetical protein
MRYHLLVVVLSKPLFAHKVLVDSHRRTLFLAHPFKFIRVSQVSNLTSVLSYKSGGKGREPVRRYEVR